MEEYITSKISYGKKETSYTFQVLDDSALLFYYFYHECSRDAYDYSPLSLTPHSPLHFSAMFVF